jgi:DNA processing protein
MTLDHAVALSLIPELPRLDLGARLRCADHELMALAHPLLGQARTTRRAAAARGIGVIAWDDARYPPPLLALPDFPPALWFRGRLQTLDAPMVAIVGSRSASAIALEVATMLAADLADRGVTVVSGLARGVDGAAHRGALSRGTTVAVLGSGPDVVYPREHTDLAATIATVGLILSEYPPGSAPIPMHFPQRNRLISGLSRAVVIVEASEKSGSLITAACALEQGRDVMAVPGNVLSGRNRGGHALIRDGAKVVEVADDILDELGLISREALVESTASHSDTVVCMDPVLRAMDIGQAYDLDGLSRASGIDGVRLLSRLLELELRGAVKRVGGGRFMRSP